MNRDKRISGLLFLWNDVVIAYANVSESAEAPNLVLNISRTLHVLTTIFSYPLCFRESIASKAAFAAQSRMQSSCISHLLDITQYDWTLFCVEWCLLKRMKQEPSKQWQNMQTLAIYALIDCEIGFTCVVNTSNIITQNTVHTLETNIHSFCCY